MHAVERMATWFESGLASDPADSRQGPWTLDRSVQRAVRRSARLLTLAMLNAACAHAGAAPYLPTFDLARLEGGDGFLLAGADQVDQAGTAVGGGGDFNGDGFDDVIVGAPLADPGGDASAGATYIVYGGAAIGEGGVIALAALDGSDGFVLNGVDAVDQSGTAVSMAGDLNGDGFDDVAIGAFNADSTGVVYVVFGGSASGAGGALDLATLDGSNGFVARGIDGNDECGSAVAGAGDVNGDGFDDLLIGAPHAERVGGSNNGESYVLFGAPQLGAGGSVALSALDGSDGFALTGVGVADYAGMSVQAAGDVNGDGIDDLVLAARTPTANGESYVVFGDAALGAGGTFALSSLDGSNGFVIAGLDGQSNATAIAGAGDVNGDGFADVVVGARNEGDGVYATGAAHVVFGGATAGAGGFVDLLALDGSDGFALPGVDAQDRAGVAVSAAGDVNGDGLDDLVVAAYLADPYGRDDAGESYVVLGAVSLGSSGTLALASLDGNNGFTLTGAGQGERSGGALSAAGDVNGDGLGDLVLGAVNASPNGQSSAGAAYVVYGGPFDSDADGFLDIEDNCALIANADQRDTNGDGFGNVCDPDLNGDLAVNFEDLGLFKSTFFSTDADADFDGDGAVNFVDLGVVKAFFFGAPGPSGLAP